MIIAIKCNYIWPSRHYSHFDTGTSASEKECLPLFSFALSWQPFQLEVQTTDMKSLNLIPCIGIHIRISYNTRNTCIFVRWKNHKCYFHFSIQKISFILQYKCLSMSLKKSWGQQQNAIGVTFHSPIVIILTFDTLGLVYSVFVRMNLGALGLPVSGWLCIHSNVYSRLS